MLIASFIVQALIGYVYVDGCFEAALDDLQTWPPFHDSPFFPSQRCMYKLYGTSLKRYWRDYREFGSMFYSIPMYSECYCTVNVIGTGSASLAEVVNLTLLYWVYYGVMVYRCFA